MDENKDNRIYFRINDPRWGIKIQHSGKLFISVNAATCSWEMDNIHRGSKMDHSRTAL